MGISTITERATKQGFGYGLVAHLTVPGRVSECQNNLENGDPVTGKAFTVAMDGTFPFTYHPEDLVFLPWFARISPSTSVNGCYTFLNGFAAPQPVCH